MELNRFFKIYITSPDGETRYNIDGTVPGLGIVEGTMKLNELICDSELEIGAYTSNKFEVQIYGLSNDVAEYSIEVYNEYIEGEPEHIFIGKIDSSKADKFNRQRTIIAYDAMYWVRDLDMSEFWLQFWSLNRQVTLAQFRKSMCAHVGLYIDPDQAACYNDDLVLNANSAIAPADVPDNTLLTSAAEPVITHNSTSSNPEYVIVQPASQSSPVDTLGIVAPASITLKFSELLRMVCELQLCCPNITRKGKIIFITLTDTLDHADLDYEANSATFQDYITDEPTGVVIYDAPNTLVFQFPVGSTANPNPYTIIGNIFLLSMTYHQRLIALAEIPAMISKITYNPATVPIIVSDLTIKPGDRVSTVRNTETTGTGTFYHFVFSQTFSGPQLVNQTIESPAYGKKLNSRVSSTSRTTAQNVRLTSMQREINGVSARVGQVVDESGNINIRDTWSANSSVAVNSDRNNKNAINDLDIVYSDFFDKLRPVVFKYNDGTSDRLHVGFIAQEVESALKESKIPTKDFGGYITLTRNGKTECGLRYEEFIALNTWEIQKLKNHIMSLEKQIADLQNKIKGE